MTVEIEGFSSPAGPSSSCVAVHVCATFVRAETLTNPRSWSSWLRTEPAARLLGAPATAWAPMRSAPSSSAAVSARSEMILSSCASTVVAGFVRPPSPWHERPGAPAQHALRAGRDVRQPARERTLAQHDVVRIAVAEPQQVAEVVHRRTLQPHEQEGREPERPAGDAALDGAAHAPALRHG